MPPTSQICHQHKPSPTSVTNIDVADIFRFEKSLDGNRGKLDFNHSSCSEQAYCETHMDYEFNIEKETWETTMVNTMRITVRVVMRVFRWTFTYLAPS